MKIVVVFSSYGPYHLARLSHFQKTCDQLNWSLVGMELARSQFEYPWKTELQNIETEVISISEEQQVEKTNIIQLFKNISSVLNRIQPDILVISGYSRVSMLFLVLWSKLNHKKAILLSESKKDDSIRSRWVEQLKRWIIRGYHSALVGGKSHKNYLVDLGMPESAVFFGYDVVDNSVFHPDKNKNLIKPIQNNYFLTISRFVRKKNIPFLISSYAAYRQRAGIDAWDLVLCGDGQLRSTIEQQILELGLISHVHLPGFLQQEQLLPYFAHAGSLIHASTQEQWGLVVNEAMAAGLPVIVSNRCGCFEDLVIEGVTGFGFNPENSQQLTDLMLKISSDNLTCKKLSDLALKHVQNFSPGYFARGLQSAIEYAVDSNRNAG
jgi:glycosyltransferase involved in cell wall biosynthesis